PGEQILLSMAISAGRQTISQSANWANCRGGALSCWKASADLRPRRHSAIMATIVARRGIAGVNGGGARTPAHDPSAQNHEHDNVTLARAARSQTHTPTP